MPKHYLTEQDFQRIERALDLTQQTIGGLDRLETMIEKSLRRAYVLGFRATAG